ncbi:hypothetical protein H072_4853 [Dactylellina haptotyla CBS 200.50]|uniref:F-box domain-containing protein n=1 Tax=Dactylellina haptotyla (strain CBS 200.50) TaxID=1284197 RepID=S8AEB5_DACHA|nr:hypothetical protein H072_4853 [Dactylellina haptotyla CBS 200.50]
MDSDVEMDLDISTPSSSTTDLTIPPAIASPAPKSRHVDLPPEIILEILSLCAWEDQDIFRHVSELWYSYILKALRRTRFNYPTPSTPVPELPSSPSSTSSSLPSSPVLPPLISKPLPPPLAKYTCGTHKLLRSLTMSYLWTRPTDEFRLDKRSDGVWWPEGSVTEQWLSKTFFWTESCTDPPMKGVKIRLKGCYWNNQEGDLVLQMTCFAGNGVAVSVADVCSRIKRLFTASPYRNVLVYDVELKMGDDGVPYLGGKAVLTKKA